MLARSGRTQTLPGMARRAAWTAFSAAAWWCFGGLVNAADIADFRVLTTVALEASSDEASGQPLFSNLTIFHQQRIYDFPLDGLDQATIFDSVGQQFTLLDARQRLQCRLSGQELIQLIAAIGQRGRGADRRRDRPGAEHAFRVSFDADAGRVELVAADEALSYVAVGQRPEHTGAAEAYGQFADWFARLNVTRDGSLPQARLRLNEELYRRNLIPVSVLRREAGRPAYSSRHQFQWSLQPDDLQRIDLAGKWSAEFAQVSLMQFRRRQAEAAAHDCSR